MGLTEATTQLDGGFTTDLDKGPQNHATRRVGNWQSDNAWDLAAPEGTVVKSYTKGKVSKITESNKKSGQFYGTSVTIDGDDDYPDIFYTHIKNVKLKQGQNVEVGDYIGQVSEWCTDETCSKKQEGTHVHVGLPNGKSLKDLINKKPSIEDDKPSKDDDNNTTSSNRSDVRNFGKNLISNMLGKAFNT